MFEEEIKCKSCSKEDATTQINVSRFINKLDSFFVTNDLLGAKKHLFFWENEAKKICDYSGLLTVLNEEIGLSRRLNDKDFGLKAVAEAEKYLEETNRINLISGATILINMATTLNCFDEAEKSISYYEQAEKVYKNNNKENTYEFAALLNNKSTALVNLQKFDEAEKYILKAIKILEEEGKHDGEIAVSYLNYAHLIFERDENVYEKVEELLDKAWDYINSPRQEHDANFAFILSKCAPSFRFFKREIEAQALEEISSEIYNK